MELNIARPATSSNPCFLYGISQLHKSWLQLDSAAHIIESEAGMKPNLSVLMAQTGIVVSLGALAASCAAMVLSEGASPVRAAVPMLLLAFSIFVLRRARSAGPKGN